MSDSLQPRGLQHTSLPCPSLSFTISQSLTQWTWVGAMMPSNHIILCCPLLLPPSVFPSIRVFSNESALHGQSIGASASVLPMNIQVWFPLGLTGLISLLSKGLSRVFSSTTVWKHQFFGAQPSFWFNFHIHTGEIISLIRQTFVGKIYLCFWICYIGWS